MKQFCCNNCGRRFEVPEEYVGKWVICKKCNISVPIPSQKNTSSKNYGYDLYEESFKEDYQFVNVWEIGYEIEADDKLLV